MRLSSVLIPVALAAAGALAWQAVPGEKESKEAPGPAQPSAGKSVVTLSAPASVADDNGEKCCPGLRPYECRVRKALGSWCAKQTAGSGPDKCSFDAEWDIQPGTCRLHPYVLMLPDPYVASQAGLYDSMLSAFMIAAAQSNFSLYTWFPDVATRPLDAETGSDIDEQALKQAEGDPATKRRPRVMLFRKSCDPSEPSANAGAGQSTCGGAEYEWLVVAPVYETPTAGVLPQALGWQLDLLASALGKKRPAAGRGADGDSLSGVLVVGPTFSASIDALALVVQRSGVAFDMIVSPTATSGRNKPTMARACGGSCTYDAVLPDFRESWCTFLRFAEEQGIGLDRVAWLLESGTPFAKSSSVSKPEGSPARQESGDADGLDEQGTLPQESDGSADNVATCETPHMYLYPFDLAAARNAASEEPPARWAMGLEGLLRQAVSPSLKGPGRTDLPHEFSSSMQATAIDRLLWNIAQDIRRERYELIVLVSSSMQDQMYLTSYLRQQIPDTRTALMDVDLMLEDPTRYKDYSGLISVSPMELYEPRCSTSQGESCTNQDTSIIFSNMASQAMFVAAERMVQYAADSGAAEDSLQIGEASVAAPVPHEIDVMSAGQWQPLDVRIGSGSGVLPEGSPRWEMGSLGGKVCLAVLLLVLCLAGWFLVSRTGSPEKTFVGVTDATRLVLNNERGATLLLGAGGAVSVWLYAPWWSSAVVAQWFSGNWWPMVTLALLGAGSCAAIAWFVLWRWKRAGILSWQLGVSLAAPCAAGVAAAVWCCLPSMGESPDGGGGGPWGAFASRPTLSEVYRLERIMDPAALLSPVALWSVLLLSLLVVCLARLRSRVLAEIGRRFQTDPLPEADRGVYSAAAAVLLAGACGVVALIGDRFITLDGAGFSWFVLIALSSGLLAAGLTAVEAWRRWREVAAMLRSLEVGPLSLLIARVREEIDKNGKSGSLFGSGTLFRRQIMLAWLCVLRRHGDALGLQPEKESLEKAMEGLESELGGGSRTPRPHQVPRNGNWPQALMAVTADSRKRHEEGGQGVLPTDGLVAACAATFHISAVVSRVKTLLVGSLLGFFATTASLLVYPLQPYRTLAAVLGTVFALLFVIDVAIYMAMDRNAILSRLNGTEPGKLTHFFVESVVLRHAITIAVLLLSFFPSAGRQVFAWLAPMLQHAFQ